MNIFREPKKLQKWCRARKAAGAKIALVPTMGYLHEGHISLITAAKRRKADEIVVSVFVNHSMQLSVCLFILWAFVTYRHKANIQRIMNGTESKIKWMG